MKRLRRLSTLLMSFALLGLLATGSMAGPGSSGRSAGSRDDVVATADGGIECDGTTDEGDGEECDANDGDGDGEDTDGGDSDSGGPDDRESADDQAEAEREAICVKAAGMEPSGERGATDTEESKAQGLDNGSSTCSRTA